MAPDGVDFDHGLNKAISKIREALGDRAENPRFVETVARRGYRFLADVKLSTPIRNLRPRLGACSAWSRFCITLTHQQSDRCSIRLEALRPRLLLVLALIASVPGISTLAIESSPLIRSLGSTAIGKPFRRCLAGLLR